MASQIGVKVADRDAFKEDRNVYIVSWSEPISDTRRAVGAPSLRCASWTERVIQLLSETYVTFDTVIRFVLREQDKDEPEYDSF